MGSLQLLSALNWVFAVLYLVGFLVVLLMAALSPGSVPVLVVVAAGLVVALFAAPHVYLALYVEKGRGRILQTVLAVPSLLNFPLGSAFSLFAIWAVWAGPSAPLFEDPSLADARHDDVQEDEGDEDDGSESPYAYARRLHQGGMNARAIRARLDRRELADEEIETVLGALGLKVPPRATPKPAATPRAAAKPAAAPRASAKPAAAPRAASPKPPPRRRS